LSRSAISQENGTFVVKRRTSARLRKKNQRVKDLRRRRELEQRTTRWTTSLHLAGSTTGLVPAVGVPLLRLLAEESGLRAGLSKALYRAGFSPVWHYSVGFDVTESVRTAITTVPADVWAPALTPEGTVRRGAYTTEITGVLELADGWPAGQRTLARTEPLHPKHRKQASEVEKRRGQRFQAVATDLPGHQYPKLDALHRNHAGVETVIKDAKNLGLKRLPSYYLAFNQAWCVAVAIASDLLAWLRLLALDHHPRLAKATPDTLRNLLHVPARLIRHARRRLIRLPADHPDAGDLTHAWQKIRALPT
jgi:hypothetical protein